MSCGPHIRRPAVAGHFYPADPQELRTAINTYLRQAATAELNPKAIIVPHAGYVYSGPIAAAAYRLLECRRGDITRVVLLGPTHHVHFRGLAATSADAYATPLGTLPIDRRAVDAALQCESVQTLDAAHLREHSLEVQLPFLQATLGTVDLVPLVVGRAETDEVATVLDQLWSGPETLIVISSDLSHYHDSATARQLDAETCRAIEARRSDLLTGNRACGYRGINGLLAVAGRRHLPVTTLDLRNSGDITGGTDRVVGYGAWGVSAAPETEATAASGPTAVDSALDADDQRTLLELARRSIAEGVAGRVYSPPPIHELSPRLQAHAATFVTLHTGGTLRGCCGSLQAFEPLGWNVVRSARTAAFDDRRFPPVAAHEVPQLDLHISVLNSPTPLPFVTEADLVEQLRPGVDGVILIERDLGRQGVFLPAVWEQLREPRQFVRRLKQKAGLAPDYWSPWLAAQRFTVQSIGDEHSARR